MSAMTQTGKQLPPILRILPHLRHEIYSLVYADIFGGDAYNRRHFINLASEGGPQGGRAQYSFPAIHRLLLTCRTTYTEVSAHVYALHHFFIKYSEIDKLEALRRLQPSSVEALQHLTIHLAVASCGFGALCHRRLEPWFAEKDEDDEYEPSYTPPDDPLHLCEQKTQDILREWESIWSTHLLPHLTRCARLNLSIVCDVANVETGVAFTRLLMTTPIPVLSNLSIRLSDRRSPELTRLAKAVADTAVFRTSKPHVSTLRSPYFRFLDLPTEIRQHILSYSDLVTPFCEAEWNPSYGWYSRLKTEGGHHYCVDAQHGRLENDPARFSYPEFPETHSMCWIRSRSDGCFCRAFHSSFSTLHKCQCWAPPSYLFLVCRRMRQDAMQAFFHHNRIVVTPVGQPFCTFWESPSQLEAARFLKETMAIDALRYLRNLEIVFPSFGGKDAYSYCPIGSPERADWLETLEYIKEKVDLSKLTVRVVFARDEKPTSQNPRFTSQDQIKQMINTYMLLTEPLKTLRGLARCFVEFADPRWYSKKPHPGLLGCISRCEEKIEKMVMGDEWDAQRAGKRKLGLSRWEQMHRRVGNFWDDLEAQEALRHGRHSGKDSL